MINIFYCSDKKYFKQLFLSLITLVDHTDEVLNVTILTEEVSEISKNKAHTEADRLICEKLLKSKNPESKVNLVDISDLFRNNLLPSVNYPNRYYHYFVTLRLVADLVPEIGDKVIYLDTDVFFNDDVKKLWNIFDERYEVMGRRDAGRITKYIHSGVMLLNMKLIRENGTFQKSCELCRKKKYVCYIDMSALNTASKKKKVIPNRFCSFKYKKDNVLHHICAIREGKVLFTKKWWHRIKTDETELMRNACPYYGRYYDLFEEYAKTYNFEP